MKGKADDSDRNAVHETHVMVLKCIRMVSRWKADCSRIQSGSGADAERDRVAIVTESVWKSVTGKPSVNGQIWVSMGVSHRAVNHRKCSTACQEQTASGVGAEITRSCTRVHGYGQMCRL